MAKRITPELKQGVHELWLKGMSYASIGRIFGVSRQRIQQIVRPPTAIYNLVVQRADWRCQDCGIELTSGHVHHNDHGSEDFNDIDNLMYLCCRCHASRHKDTRHGRVIVADEQTREPIMVDLTKLSCCYCSHEWYPRHPKPPKVCPRCKRTGWEKTKTERGSK